jgi:23S rRNA pseudouridine1911/1915/1917 synthase
MEDSNELSFNILAEDEGQRIDKYLAGKIEDVSRTRIKNLIQGNSIFVDGKIISDPSYKIKEGDSVSLTMPEPEEFYPKPENIPLDIIYEDNDILVLNKQVGLVVHPGAGHKSGTLVNALLYHCKDSLSGIGGIIRPGIVHRLDKDTSGIMIVAKNDKAHLSLSGQLEQRALKRSYKALVWGEPDLLKDTVSQPIGRHPNNRVKMAVTAKNGKEAVTHFQVVKKFGCISLLDCKLQTGRTHQIRVHLAHISYPIVGDPLYGAQKTLAQSLLNRASIAEEKHAEILDFPRQALHAFKLEFCHPSTGENMAFEAPMADDIDQLLNQLNQ